MYRQDSETSEFAREGVSKKESPRGTLWSRKLKLKKKQRKGEAVSRADLQSAGYTAENYTREDGIGTSVRMPTTRMLYGTNNLSASSESENDDEEMEFSIWDTLFCPCADDNTEQPTDNEDTVSTKCMARWMQVRGVSKHDSVYDQRWVKIAARANENECGFIRK